MITRVTTEPEQPPRKEWRIARDVRMALAIGRQPRSIVPLVRGWLVKLWASRGGGLYGLGYVVTFAALEAQSMAGDFASVSGVVAQALQYVIRFSVESFLNGIRALIWPVHLFEWLGATSGLAVLGLGYIAFELALRPLVQAQFPELEEAVAERERLKQEKKARKRSKRGQ
jgi:hypothetical protein